MSDLFTQTRGHGDLHLALPHGWTMHGNLLEPLFGVPGGRCARHAVDP